MPINRFIDQMGVELEGGWIYESHCQEFGIEPGTGYARNNQPPNYRQDASLHFEDYPCSIHGETASEPFSNLRSLEAYVRTHYPQIVNDTCGLHVHYSFRSLGLYACLMDQQFLIWFQRQMIAWADREHLVHQGFRNRLGGLNRFCRWNYYPDEQARAFEKRRMSGEVRWNAWNFCLSIHGTAECRLLPMFPTADEAIVAIKAQRDAVMLWLENHSGETVLFDSNEPENETREPETEREDITGEVDTDQPEIINLETVCV